MAWVHIEDEFGGTYYEYEHSYDIRDGWVYLDGEKTVELISYRVKKRRNRIIRGLILGGLTIVLIVAILAHLEMFGYF